VLKDDVIGRMPGCASAPRGRLGKVASVLAICLAALVWIGSASAAATVIDPVLLAKATSSPSKSERVIIISDKAVSGATSAFNKASAVKDGYGTGTLGKQLPLVGGVAVTLPAARMSALAKISGLTVSPDATLKQTVFDNYYNVQLWPYLSGFAHLWTYQ